LTVWCFCSLICFLWCQVVEWTWIMSYCPDRKGTVFWVVSCSLLSQL
jgi:hypothetical protein